MSEAVRSLLTRLVTATKRELEESERPVLGCAHVVRGGAPVLTVCVAHPASGVLCDACATEHHERHGEERCSACGAVPPDDPLRWSSTLPMGELLVEDTEGVALVIPRVSVDVWGPVFCSGHLQS